MKKISFLWIIMLLTASFALAESFESSNTISHWGGAPRVDVILWKYDPYPVNPGEYFDLWIEVVNPGLGEMDVNFELVPEYPFSLDSNEVPTKQLKNLEGESALLEYKVRVDKNAVEGVNEIELRYKTGINSWAYETFDIKVSDAQTDFDLVVQELSDDSASIAIANIGKNIAYSVIVRVPEQENFRAIGTSGQMVGNLEAGDYTLVGFEISGTPGNRNSSEKLLELQIDYTDEIGERRSLIKEVVFETGDRQLPEGMTREDMIAQRGGKATQQKTYQKWWFWAVIIVVLVAGWKIIRRLKKNKERKEEKRSKR